MIEINSKLFLVARDHIQECVCFWMGSDDGITFRWMRKITPTNTPRDGQATLAASAAKWLDETMVGSHRRTLNAFTLSSG